MVPWCQPNTPGLGSASPEIVANEIICHPALHMQLFRNKKTGSSALDFGTGAADYGTPTFKEQPHHYHRWL
jgi:hypothetical protein